MFGRWRAKLHPRAKKPLGLLLLSCGGLGDTVLLSHVIEHFCSYAADNEPVTILLRKDGAKTAFLFPDHVKTFIVDFPLFHKNLTYRFTILDSSQKAREYESIIKKGGIESIGKPYLNG